MKKRFEIKATGASHEKDFSMEAQEIIKELQAKQVSPIELIDHHAKKVFLYRKGSHDKNYFVRERELLPPGEGANNLETDSNIGDHESEVQDVQEVVKSKRSRNVKE